MAELDRATVIAALVRSYAQLLEERLPLGPVTLEQIETLVEDLGRQQDTELEETLIRSQQPSPANQEVCPKCQGPALFKRSSALQVLTIHGSRRLVRRYHRCDHCGHGFAPWDLRLELDEHRATRQVRAWQAKYGGLDAFITVPELLLDLRGLVISESTVERTTLEVGRAILAEVATAPRPRETVTPGPPLGSRRLPGVERLYLEMDGVMCPLREPWRRDGSLGKLQCGYEECKVGVVFQTGRADGLDTGIDWCAYTATLDKIDGFTSRMVALARAHGSDRARELVVLGDGAHWIWNLCEQHFPQAVQIVDYWHMTEHLYKLANAQFGKGSAAGKQWVADCQWYLDRELTVSVLAKILEWKPQDEEHRKLRDTEYGYFASNQERMRYETYLRHGYHIGSGVVEATCRRLVTQRMKQAGMHWRKESAEAVLAIRSKLLSTASCDLRSYC